MEVRTGIDQGKIIDNFINITLSTQTGRTVKCTKLVSTSSFWIFRLILMSSCRQEHFSIPRKYLWNHFKIFIKGEIKLLYNHYSMQISRIRKQGRLWNSNLKIYIYAWFSNTFSLIHIRSYKISKDCLKLVC